MLRTTHKEQNAEKKMNEARVTIQMSMKMRKFRTQKHTAEKNRVKWMSVSKHERKQTLVSCFIAHDRNTHYITFCIATYAHFTFLFSEYFVRRLFNKYATHLLFTCNFTHSVYGRMTLFRCTLIIFKANHFFGQCKNSMEFSRLQCK